MYDRNFGKAHLEIRLRSREHAKHPLERVYMDIIPSSIPSIEGYNKALIIVDDASMYQRVCGLKETSDSVRLMLRLENGFLT